jgi:hypothetical protein
MCVCLMIAEDGEYGADTLVHSLQADGAVGQLRTSLTHRVVLALLSGKTNTHGPNISKDTKPLNVVFTGFNRDSIFDPSCELAPL